MKKSKVFSVVTSAALVSAMLLAGCGNNDSGNSSGSTSSNTPSSQESTSSGGSSDSSSSPAADSGSDSNLLPALSEAEQGKPGQLTAPRSSYVQYPYEGAEGITLTYWMSVPSNILNHPDTPDSVQMTQWAQRWQELTGITIEFIGPATTNSDEINTAFNLMTTGSKLPDIIEWEWTSGYPGGPAAAEQDGVLIWLDDYITPDGPAADLWQYLQDNPSLDTAVKTDEGHYYTFPFTRGDRLLGTTSGPIVRKDLVEAAGHTVDEMVTIADWTEVMTAMKENGVKYPLSFESKSYMENLLPGAFGIRAAMYVSAEDGKVHFGRVEEGYRQFLEQVIEWMNAGLVNPEPGDWTGANTKADILNGDSAISYGALGSRLGTWNGVAWAEPDTYGADFELVGVQFPVAQEGQAVRYSGGSTDYATGSKAHAAISEDCQYPEIAAAFLNFCYSQAGHNEINFGEEGVSYNGFVDTEYGSAAAYSDLIMKSENGIAVEMAHYGRGNMSGAFIQSPAYILGYYETEQQKAAVSLWAQNDVSSTILPPVTMTPEESNEYTSLNSQIDTAVTEFRDKVLAARELTDETWNAYIEQLKGMNVDRMIELQQNALDRYNAR